MQSGDFIKLLNCTARFIDYGKLNVLAIFDWEQTVLFKQTGKQAVRLKSYKKWNKGENRIVSGKGIELDIDGCEEKIRFFDVSQTSEQKFKGNAKSKADSMNTEELPESHAADISEVGFTHRHRGLLLTALWMELSVFQKEYEKLLNAGNEALLCHVSVIYIIHSHFKSNWQDDSAVEAAFSAETAAKPDILDSFFSQLFQAAVNLTVKIEKRFEALVSNSESEAAENGYMRTRFYDICDKEKVAVCRLKPTEKVNINLSIDSFEIVETLPYKPGMEREAFLEYLQSLFNNSLTLEHLVLVRRKNASGVTVVTAYRVEVSNWNRKPLYVDFEIVTIDEAKSYYLRLVASEVLDGGDNGGAKAETKPEVKPVQQITAKPENPPPIQPSAEDSISEPANKSNTPKAAVSAATESVKRKHKNERTDVLEKVNRLKEDMRNKTC